MKNEKQNQLFKIGIVVLLFLIIVIFTVINLLIINSQPTYIHSSNLIKNSDEVNFKSIEETVVHWYDLPNDREMNYNIIVENPESYPLGNEVSLIGTVLTAFGYDFNIEDFLKDTINYDYGAINTEYSYIEGSISPKNLAEMLETYADKYEMAFHTRDISGLTFGELKEYVNNNWPVMVWYDKDYKGEVLDYRWQFADVGLVYKIDDNKIYLVHPREGKIEMLIKDFRFYWQGCGNYAVIF